MGADDSPFPPDGLAANQSGRLTDAQLRLCRAVARGVHKRELSTAGFVFAGGIISFVVANPARAGWIRPAVLVGCVLIAAFLVVRAVTGGDALTQDLRRVEVQSVEGAIKKWTRHVSGETSSSTYHYLGVASQTFEVGSEAYSAAPEAGIVRIYFLPRSHRVVNLEHLPDRPLPPDALSNPLGVVPGLLRASLSRDSVASAEARATLAALGNVVKVDIAEAAVPPPQEDRDPRPLEVAILGTWRNALMTISFTSDGRATATLPGGRERSGRWSVDPNGRLHADVMGHDQAANAWVVGDELTIATEDRGLTFTRRSGG